MLLVFSTLKVLGLVLALVVEVLGECLFAFDVGGATLALFASVEGWLAEAFFVVSH